jgi:hypothetical protein
MNANNSAVLPRPPRLFASLKAGFDTVASHVALILFPVALDLFLWFGPRWSLGNAARPIIDQMRDLSTFTPSDALQAQSFKAGLDAWAAFFHEFNLATALRTFPVGIPSLMFGEFVSQILSIFQASSPGAAQPQATLQNPIGLPMTTQMPNMASGVLLFLVFVLVGLVSGALYFALVARASLRDESSMTFGQVGWLAGQTLLLAISWIVLGVMIAVPVTLMIVVLTLISPGIAQIGLFAAILFLIWILLPLVFSPHGIFVYRQNALISMLTSARLVRFILPGTGMFVLSVLVISQGLDVLWSAPPLTSWMMLIGIGGHAFIATGLLAASFVYYRDAMRFVQEFLQRTLMAQTRTT